MKYLMLFTCALMFTTFAKSQEGEPTTVADWDPKLYQINKMYPGYVITFDNDTVRGFIKAGPRCSTNGIGSSNQNLCEFFTNENDKKPLAKYKPDDIKGYMIADKVYESIAYSGGLLKKKNFNLVVTDGKIRIYDWYSTKENFSSIRQQSGESYQDYDARRFDTNTVIAKDGLNPMVHSSLGLKFVERMSELVSENEEMVQKIKNKEKGYKMINMFSIIAEYNVWAENNL